MSQKKQISSSDLKLALAILGASLGATMVPRSAVGADSSESLAKAQTGFQVAEVTFGREKLKGTSSSNSNSNSNSQAGSDSSTKSTTPGITFGREKLKGTSSSSNANSKAQPCDPSSTQPASHGVTFGREKLKGTSKTTSTNCNSDTQSSTQPTSPGVTFGREKMKGTSQTSADSTKSNPIKNAPLLQTESRPALVPVDTAGNQPSSTSANTPAKKKGEK
jgi:hypothetical protein